MNGDVIRICRLIIDSLPTRIRNSKLLFNILAAVLNENKFLYNFRDFYDQNPDFSLSELYKEESPYYSNSYSTTTDCNSLHQTILKKYLLQIQPSSLIDVGCGSGYLLEQIHNYLKGISLYGIDLASQPHEKDSEIKIYSGDLNSHLLSIEDNSYEVAICSHVVEHLNNPRFIISELRRISTIAIVVILPLEKKFKWGLNYHVQFFADKEQFLKLARPSKNSTYNTYEFLGDLMYIEKI